MNQVRKNKITFFAITYFALLMAFSFFLINQSGVFFFTLFLLLSLQLVAVGVQVFFYHSLQRLLLGLDKLFLPYLKMLVLNLKKHLLR
jgi:hypothetical protein